MPKHVAHIHDRLGVAPLGNFSGCVDVRNVAEGFFLEPGLDCLQGFLGTVVERAKILRERHLLLLRDRLTAEDQNCVSIDRRHERGDLFVTERSGQVDTADKGSEISRDRLDRKFRHVRS